MAAQNGHGVRPPAKDDEETPLLRVQTTESAKRKTWARAAIYKSLGCAFLVSMSFGVTQVPLIYVFRVMTCDAYYKNHESPPPGSVRDRCDVPEIEASTAKAVALLGAGTTLFGLVNLLVTGWLIKRIGVKAALLTQVFWPAARLVIQNIGVATGGFAGIVIVQCSQIITIIGGPNGYLLALNTFITELVNPEERTPSLGRLQGAMFGGTSIGYFIGGDISERFGIISPFRLALILFCIDTLYVFFLLPWLPKQAPGDTMAAAKGFQRLIGPLRVFAPRIWRLNDGRMKREYGAILLAAGLFFGILATGYIPTLLQMFSTDVFGFGTRENGNLIALNSVLRGLFLTFIFPSVIAYGREKVQEYQEKQLSVHSSSPSPDVPPQAATIDIVDSMDNEQEPLVPPQGIKSEQTYDFDLMYARYSLLLDGVITGGATFITQGWQIYLIATLLPFAAGTSASSKGSILQMCSARERIDALQAITLVENMARLMTTSVFGLIFAAFAGNGNENLVFSINAAVALLGFGILVFSRFPPKDAKRLEDAEDDEHER